MIPARENLTPRPAAPGAARRLLGFLLAKLDAEPLDSRAELCADLAAVVPDEAVARHLLAQARSLRRTGRRALALRLALEAARPRSVRRGG